MPDVTFPREASAPSRHAPGGGNWPSPLEQLVARRDVAYRRYLDAQREVDTYQDAATSGN